MVIPLSELKSFQGRSATLGTGISALHLIVPSQANDVFFIDNLFVARLKHPLTTSRSQ